ncbi:universal stress protein [Mucilaginibacter sp. UC70_90]
MEKILVTTDQSANSKAAIRFAIKLASQRKAELTILHVYHLLKPFKWTYHAFAAYTNEFRKKTTDELSSFIAGIYRDIDEREINYELVLVSNIDVSCWHHGLCQQEQLFLYLHQYPWRGHYCKNIRHAYRKIDQLFDCTCNMHTKRISLKRIETRPVCLGYDRL